MNTYKFQNFDSQEGIAVIGMSGRFPGANNLVEFWDNLVSERDTIHTFSDDELRSSGIAESLIQNPYYIKRRGILTGIEYFDANLFQMTPTQAEMTDPQHRLFIEICAEALINSGYGEQNEALSAGVFAGMSDSTYLPNMLLKNEIFLQNFDPYQAQIANSGHFLATKVAYHLNLKGPAINIQTACSTSLVTVIKACQSLEAYECDMALAGGVSISVPQMKGYLYQEGGVFSQDGFCRAFDTSATGMVSSNGLGVVVLKRLSDALRDGDPINAIIISHALNNDGSAKNGYTAPSVSAQSDCIAKALMQVDPDSISYVEAHGTATLLGDPVEMAALTRAFRQFTNRENYCAIGSVKTNIGHTDTASGIAGFIKTVLALKHKTIPASLHFSKPNPYIDFDASPFYVQKTTSEWKTNSRVRRAGVSSFGIGGTNAHLVLQEAPDDSRNLTQLFTTSRGHKNKYWVEPDLNDCTFQKQDHEIFLYEPYWEVSALISHNRMSLNNKTWVIFSNNESNLEEVFIKHLSVITNNIFRVYPGETFQKISDWSFQINPRSRSDYEQLWQSLDKNNQKIDHITYFWSIVDNQKKINILEKNCLEEGMLSLISLIQTLGKYNNTTSLLVAANYTQKVLSNDKIFADQACLAAPLLTVSQEHEKISCRLIDIAFFSHVELENTAAMLIQESRMLSNENIIAYRNEIRFAKKYKNILLEKDVPQTLLKRNGVYLIIGAFGKVGMHLAAHLASHYAAHLILVSRRTVSDFLNQNLSEKESREQIWRTIEENSSSLKLVAADISNDDAISGIINGLKGFFNKIDGIFHLAAATNSPHVKTLIADISTEQISEQLLPKIKGIDLACKVSKEIPTEFCCLFSSLSTVAGGVGLTSYIAGNIYLDSIAEIYKNNDHPRWISIGWDAIETGKNGALSELTLSQTMQLVERLISKNWEASHIIISADPISDKINYTLKRKSVNEIDSHKKMDNNELDETSMARDIITIFRTCLGLKNIDENKSFYELGGDSLDAIRFLELFEKKFNIRLSLNDLNKYSSAKKLQDLLLNKVQAENTPLIKLNKFSDAKPILFLVHPIGGTTFCYSSLAQALSGKVNCYGIQDPSLSNDDVEFQNIEEMARKYLCYIADVVKDTDFFIGGYSFGANVAFEMARQLKEDKKKTNPVVIIDGWAAFSDELASYNKFKEGMKQLIISEERENIIDEGMEEKYFIDLAWDRARLLLQYNPSKMNVPIVLFKARELLPEYESVDDPTNYWQFYTNNILKIHHVDANHSSILHSNTAKEIAESIADLIYDLHKHVIKNKSF